MQNRIIASFLIATLLSLPVVAQSSSNDTALLAKIREEAMQRSQIMKTMHMFTDLYGPRLTGSPNHKNAADWAVRQMTAWGLQNAHIEPWDFGHPGWLNERLTAHVIAPIKDSLVCEVLAWTPSTKGVVQAKTMQLVLPDRPTQEQLTSVFAGLRSRVRGRIVMVGKPAVLPVNLNPPAKRLTDEQLQQRFGPNARPFPQASPTPSPAPNARSPTSHTCPISSPSWRRCPAPSMGACST